MIIRKIYKDPEKESLILGNPVTCKVCGCGLAGNRHMEGLGFTSNPLSSKDCFLFPIF